MKRFALLPLSVLLIAGVSALAAAQAPTSKSMDMNKMDMKSMDMMDKDKKAGSSHSGTGVVQNVDAAGGSITLAHDPITSLKWPAMTMGFKVKDKSLFDKVKPGDKVQFTVVQSGKGYVVTSIK